MIARKKSIDRGESIPGFKCPVDSIFEETQEFHRALGKYKFFNRYFRFIFDIGLDSLRRQPFLLAPRRLGRAMWNDCLRMAMVSIIACRFLRVVHG